MTRKTLSTSYAHDEGDAACRPEHQRPKFRDRWAHDPARRLGAVSQRIRKRIEEAFGWIKVVAGQEKTKFRRPRPCPDGLSPSWPPPTIQCGCPGYWRCPADGQGSLLRQGVCRTCWRIVEMDVWDNDFLDLIEEAHLTFKGAADGEIAFGALKGFLDVRYGARDGSACAEFSWEGHDENDPACGRGWAVFGTAGRLVGHFYIHNADDSGFVCERA